VLALFSFHQLRLCAVGALVLRVFCLGLFVGNACDKLFTENGR